MNKNKTKQIQMLVGRMQVMKFHNPVCENVSHLLPYSELDVVSISKSGMMYEFEVKISRSDFLADKKKKKHAAYSLLPESLGNSRCPNYFSYVCPNGLIKPEEIAAHTGLYYVDGEKVIEIKKPKIMQQFIHNKKEIIEKISRVYSERHFLGMCRLTLLNKQIRERNALLQEKMKSENWE